MGSGFINIGVIGCGQWGPNHIRVFSHLSQSKVLMCADLDFERLQSVQKTFLDTRVTTDYKEILSNPDIDAVCIAAPTNLHYSITKEALEYGKHVLCEKPLAMRFSDCRELFQLASSLNKVLLVGHVFLFNAGIVWLKEYIDSGELGAIHYAYATRTNLGPFRYDVNALWDLAPHDVSIFNYLFDSVPINVSARGQKSLGSSLEDLAFATLEYPNDILANIHVSWLDPRKVRQITIVGDKKMIVWDDLDNVGPIRLYDKHVDKITATYETYGEFQLLSREGNIMIPKISVGEPLKMQAEYFLNCIEKGILPEVSDAKKGGNVVKTLYAIQESMDQKGACISL